MCVTHEVHKVLRISIRVYNVVEKFPLFINARRYSLKLCFFYKLLNGLAFMPNSLVDYRRNLPYSTRSHSYSLQVPFACTTSYYKSFFCEAPRLWNELPIEVVSSTSFTSLESMYVSLPWIIPTPPCYVSLAFLCVCLFVCLSVCLFLGTWSVLACFATNVSYVLYMKYYGEKLFIHKIIISGEVSCLLWSYTSGHGRV